LNQMADRLHDAHEDLESRVRERTSEFLRAARMAHLGVLASGIAHEINTPLASIRSCAEGMDRRMKLGEYSDGTEAVLREDATLIFPKKNPELVNPGQPLVYLARSES